MDFLDRAVQVACSFLDLFDPEMQFLLYLEGIAPDHLISLDDINIHIDNSKKDLHKGINSAKIKTATRQQRLNIRNNTAIPILPLPLLLLTLPIPMVPLRMRMRDSDGGWPDF